MKLNLSKEQAEDIGHRVREFLYLAKKRNGRVPTAWGDKTDLGLGACIERIINEVSEAAKMTNQTEEK